MGALEQAIIAVTLQGAGTVVGETNRIEVGFDKAKASADRAEDSAGRAQSALKRLEAAAASYAQTVRMGLARVGTAGNLIKNAADEASFGETPGSGSAYEEVSLLGAGLAGAGEKGAALGMLGSAGGAFGSLVGAIVGAIYGGFDGVIKHQERIEQKRTQYLDQRLETMRRRREGEKAESKEEASLQVEGRMMTLAFEAVGKAGPR